MDRVFKACHKHVQSIISKSALVRQGCLPINTVSELQRRMTCEAIKHGEYLIDDAFVPSEFPEKTSPAVLQGLLTTEKWISALTQNCLQFYLERFRQLRPMTLADPDREFTSFSAILRLREENPPQVPFPRRDLGPPTWVEEQLVCRAFWRIQLLEDLKQAVSDGTLQWADEEMQKLQSMDPVELYKFEDVADKISLPFARL